MSRLAGWTVLLARSDAANNAEITALPLTLERRHRVRVADHARNLDPAGLQVLLRRPQSPPRRLCAPMWVLDLPLLRGRAWSPQIRPWPCRARSCRCQLGGIRRPVGKDKHERPCRRALHRQARARLAERWWMAPIRGTLMACTPSGRRRRGPPGTVAPWIASQRGSRPRPRPLSR
jgi:hypothetical protein